MEQEFFLGNLLEIENLKEYIEDKYFMNTNGYKFFEKFISYKFDKCKECHKNLMCFTCTRQLIRTIELNKFEEVCKINSEIYDLYWEDFNAL